MPPRKYTDLQLACAVAESKNMREVLVKLGMAARGGNYENVWRQVRQLSLSTDHFVGYDGPSNIKALGKMIDRLGLDISHHLGQAWRKGSTRPVRAATPLSEVLVNGRPCHTRSLKKRLVDEGLKERRCERCRAGRWFGQPLALELHHVNGNREDNRLQNLQLLCANCHSQTSTYRGRNIGRMA